ncbi:MazG nucleotide pyrophosphohydrolase domain-containing protein [Specibacter cremeus]|uniref:MazG nucleotide pyrophosphohydrolase domain-containing protein n=1 Tax=Specibacter cremeus TaxID=1629051 RepID=UPI000F773532|nr:MazG nucleotide pyrophosphohydrolase domain-containing protein [Specibacter cremeus]
MSSTDADTGGVNAPGAAVDRLVQVVAALREHCLWTAALTHESLVAYLIEESYELADVVEAGAGPLDDGALEGELADILYQVLLHARLQEEAGGFTLADVADHLREKLIRRNRHVFRADGTLQPRFPDSIAEIERSYGAAKAAERVGAGPDGSSVFSSLPASLPALALAAKSLERAGAGDRAQLSGDRAQLSGDRACRDPGPRQARPPVVERGGDRACRDPGDPPQTEDELGDFLLNAVRAARANGLDPERALRGAVRRFQAGVDAHPPSGSRRPLQSESSL